MISSYIFIIFAIVLIGLLPFGMSRVQTTWQTYYTPVTVDSRDELPTTITENNIGAWGNIPGLFNSTYTTGVEITTYQPFDWRTGKMGKALGVKEYWMDTTKDVVPLQWNDTESMVQF